MGRKVFSTGLGEYFTALRTAKGWSQRQAEDVAINRKRLQSINRQTIFRLERGVVKHPPAEVLRDLAELYDEKYEDMVAAVTAEIYGRELPRHTGTGVSLPGGSPDDATTDRLLAAAREAGRLEGHQQALFRLAKTIASEIERLAGEGGVADADAPRPRTLRRKTR
jgi:hypothetical protein